ncbi:hypothetical protein ACRS52_18985 [Bacillus cytotoxicus]|uniref:hypothetical protein n=1 Tax=Bacillaceae TaxID=186817 RepID=UPI001AEE6C1D|nr:MULTISPECIES: hypothetical protein [Bacillaceae]MED3781862.1 hypothetical protein [Heyndrickxia sporothermodurans]QTR71174.1 hypothetical protein JC775_00260 [Bacillus cytotoxicus]HDR7314286.1 hypothetical protein [Bacillus cytotoxicus]
MIRFPNPGSNIPTMTKIFQVLYSYLNKQYSFSLDDMSRTLTLANLASSSGYMGEEALNRSTRKERALDPLYNQSKMYAEVYRTLGWIQSTPESKLTFSFTLLGEHMATAKSNPLPLIRQCLLGINYPNKVLGIKSPNINRPFFTILKTMKDLGGVINRDEMIIGPLSLSYTDENYIKMINKLGQIREALNNKQALKQALEDLSRELKIQVNTLHNYTRFPMAALRYSKWVEDKPIKIYKGSPTMLSLTEEGEALVNWLNEIENVYYTDIDKMDENELAIICRIGFFEMLERADFDIEHIKGKLFADKEYIQKRFNKDILFSPYQTLPQSFGNQALLPIIGQITSSESEAQQVAELSFENQTVSEEPVRSTILLQNTNKNNSISTTEIIVEEINKLAKRHNNSIEIIVEELSRKYKNSDKNDFYPLVSSLFRTIGFNCENPRHGINYQRWDAIIIHDRFSIPIEIKSPSEEEYLSVKAVRQALENKIVLLSRKSYTTDRDSVSLAIGYKVPNNRSDVHRLINDIKNTFNIKIGILDINTLFYIAAKNVIEGKELSIDTLKDMEGIINVQDI